MSVPAPLRRIHLVSVAGPDTLHEFSVALESIRRQVQSDIVEIRALHAAVAELRQADALILPRVVGLETDMDNIPARVSDLEKYGSEHTIKLEPRVDQVERQIKRLKKRPKKKRRKEQGRQNRVLMYVFMAQAGFALLSVLVSVYLAHH
jgi:hypothetical protein